MATDDSRRAIEVELHSKAPDRLRAILRAYRRQIGRGELATIGYITTKPLVARSVQRTQRIWGSATACASSRSIRSFPVYAGEQPNVRSGVAVQPQPQPQPLTRSQVMRAGEVAELLRVPVSTIHEWARDGRLPSRKRGRHRLFIRSEVEPTDQMSRSKYCRLPGLS